MLEAHGQIQADLSRLIKQMDHEELRREVATLLTARFSHLGEIKERGFRRQMGRVSLQVGRYLIQVNGTWVEINTLGRYQPGDPAVIRELRQALTELLAGLAGMALQRKVTREIINAGYSIRTMNRTEGDVALLRMDWATVTITLAGALSITTSENYRPVVQRLLSDLEAAGIEINRNS